MYKLAVALSLALALAGCAEGKFNECRFDAIKAKINIDTYVDACMKAAGYHFDEKRYLHDGEQDKTGEEWRYWKHWILP